MTIWTALAIWLAVSVIATALAGRFLWACSQADQDAADDIADSERAVLLQEFNPTFHAALINGKKEHDNA